MLVSQGKILDKVRVWMLRSVFMVFDEKGPNDSVKYSENSSLTTITKNSAQFNKN